MISRKDIEKESFSRCPETCPAVDDAASDFLGDIRQFIPDACSTQVENMLAILVEKFKDVGTHLLRSALYEAIEERQELEERVNELERRLDEVGVTP